MSCGGGGNPPAEPTPKFERVDLGELQFNSSPGFNGTIDHLNDNSWVFSGMTNTDCVSGWKCRRVNIESRDVLSSNRVTKYSFEYMLADIQLNEFDWIIVFQDWVEIIPWENDKNGNHPISTIKLKRIGGAWALCHYDNSWQWEYDFGDNKNDESIDLDHSLHQKNTLNGCSEIEVGISYDIEIIIDDAGRFTFLLNDSVISDTTYQTKSQNQPHVIMWGQYWDKFNMSQAIFRFDNFTKWVVN